MALADVPDLAKKLAQRAADEQADGIVEVLGELERCPMDKNTLASTKVGITVNKLKKHADQKVKELATKLVNQWKSVVAPANHTPKSTPGSPSSSSHSHPGSSPSTASSASSSPHRASSHSSATSSPSHPSSSASSPSRAHSPPTRSTSSLSTSSRSSHSPKRSRSPASAKRKTPTPSSSPHSDSSSSSQPSAKKAKRSATPTTPGKSLKEKEASGEFIPLKGGHAATTHAGTRAATKADEYSDDAGRHGPVPLGRTGDKVRNFIQGKLAEAIGPKQSADQLEPTWLAVEIEQAMFEQFSSTGREYKEKFRQLAFNLNDKKNPELNERLKCGTLRPRGIIFLSDAELASSELEKERQESRENEKQAARSDWARDHVQTTDFFKCGRCHQRKCTFYQMQTRSSDEPMTIFITCMQCGKQWRQ